MESTEDFLKAVASGKHRTAAGKRLRKIVAERDLKVYGSVCCFCCHVEIAPKKATLEHIIPVSLGGKTVLDNLALSHSKCNEKRGNYDYRWLTSTQIPRH